MRFLLICYYPFWGGEILHYFKFWALNNNILCKMAKFWLCPVWVREIERTSKIKKCKFLNPSGEFTLFM